MAKTMSAIVDMQGEDVILELQDADDLHPRIVQGKLLRASYHGIAIQEANQTSIIDLSIVQDIYPASKQGKVVRRRLRYIVALQVRQHLLDRHGMQFDLIRALTPKVAKQLHDKIDHSNLGHRHKDRAELGLDEEDED